MSRKSKTSRPVIGVNTLVVDNGGYTIKAGFASSTPDPHKECSVIPNCIARSNEGSRSHKIYVADQLEQCKNTAEMAFRRPVEKGFIVNWEAELDIWKQAFLEKDSKVPCGPHETNLILTEAPNCPQALQYHTDQVVFEEFEFAAAYRSIGASLNAYNDIPALMGDAASRNPPAECLVVVDSGYSYTTVTPLIYGRPVQKAIRRLDVGGKTLTNLLKELASLRHWNLMDDSYLVSQIKEDTCYVSLDFNRDLEKVWNMKNTKSKSAWLEKAQNQSILQEYVLPDYHTTFRGHVREAQQRLRPEADDQTRLPLGNERFVVPELLFNPSDIGFTQAGLPELIVQSLSNVPGGLRPGFLANIVVVGGNAKIPGFMERLDRDLRPLIPSECTLRIRKPEDPITYTWQGGARMASNNSLLKSALVTRQEYQENGSLWTARQFASGPQT